MSSLKRLYGMILQLIEKIVGIDAAKKFDSYLRFRKKINLKNPETLADKVCYLELHKRRVDRTEQPDAG